MQRIETYQWIAFYKPECDQTFFEQMKQLKIDHRRLANVRFAVVGSAQKEALERMISCRLYAGEVYDKSSGRRLFAAMQRRRNCRFARAVKGSQMLFTILEEKQH